MSSRFATASQISSGNSQNALRLNRNSRSYDYFIPADIQQQHQPQFGPKSLVEENSCSQNLLTIVARGNAIITELFRLADLVPQPFRYDENEPLACQYLDSKDRTFTLDDLIFNFDYFKSSEILEAKIEANPVLKRADENLCDNLIDILSRFYLTFESVYRYATDLNEFVLELEEEVFVGNSLDGLLAKTESRQLLCEAFFLLGYMLLVTDANFEGALRERLIVSYYRYSSHNSAPNSNFDETCNLMRSTGFRTKQQQIYRSSSPVNHHRPEGYPESFLSRVRVNQSLINLLIAKMQSIDIYNQILLNYPHPDHRSAALAQQASMLYVLLYFCPKILNSHKSRMREIADKFFYDNWVISVYMGDLVNLIEAWEPYKAAKESLSQLLEVETTRQLVDQHSVRFNRLGKQLQDTLRDGLTNDDYIIENQSKILNIIRDSNVILRWILLHSQLQTNWQLRLSRTTYSLVINSKPEPMNLYLFLQNLAELEKKFLISCDKLVMIKQTKISECKTKSEEIIDDLISIFSETQSMRWIQVVPNKKLADILTNLKLNLNTIDFNESTAGDSIIKLIGDLESARDSYLDGKSMQVVELFMLAKDTLLKILKLLSVSEDIKVTLQTVGDFSYAWRIVDEIFTGHMQQVIKDDPLKVYGIESIFLKLTSSFDISLIRIQQVDSKADLISVSQYYSMKLVSYVRDVLQVIPATILELVSNVVTIQTDSVIGHMPVKVSLDNLKDYALTEKRFQMLELTYKISHYAESLLKIQNTTIGLIRIDSKQLLEDGIRREFVKRLSDSIQSILIFPDSLQSLNIEPRVAADNLLQKLTRLESLMNGYKRSFEYIQDYLFIYGLRIWQEELSRIIKFNLELAVLALNVDNATNGFIADAFEFQPSSNISDQQHSPSLYQSVKAPIPVYGFNKLQSSFVWRLLNELLRITEPRATIYNEQMSAWYDQKTKHDNVIDLKVFELISSSLSVTGLNGLDQLCCSLLMVELQKLDELLISLVSGRNLQSQMLIESLEQMNQMRRTQVSGVYSRQQSNRIFGSALAKVAPHSETITNYLLRIGQLQAIRTNISIVVSTKCRCEAKNLYSCLEACNSALLSVLKPEARQEKSMRGSSQQKSNLNQKALDSGSQDLDLDATLSSQHLGETDNQSLSEDDFGLEFKLENLDDSQLIFELTNQLEWIGLSDPLNKIYTLALQASSSSQVFEFRQRLLAIDLIFLVLLDQSSNFQFSRSTSGFLPRQSRSFLKSSSRVDGQPLFYGLVSLVNHYEPYLTSGKRLESRQSAPADASSSDSEAQVAVASIRLLELMSLYVKCSLEQQNLGNYIKANELTVEATNMTLSIIELLRLSRQPTGSLLARSYLPDFLADTFQFTFCHLSSSATPGS